MNTMASFKPPRTDEFIVTPTVTETLLGVGATLELLELEPEELEL